MEQKRTTQIWRLIQQYMDGQVVEVKQSAIANAIGVGRSTLSQWKYGQTRPTPANLCKLHEITRIPYQTFLDALLVDMGYLDAEEVMGNAKHPAPIEPEKSPRAPRGRAASAPTKPVKGGVKPRPGNSHITLLPEV